MQSAGLRHRRKSSAASLTSHGSASSLSAAAGPAGPSFRTAFALLLAARLVAARYNIVHDCDEVYNYWEPLHYLLFGSGLQTWEYSARFALRPYLYLLLHAPVAGAAALAAGRAAAFYATRAALAAASAAAEASLIAAAGAACGRRTAVCALALALPCAGLFAAAPALLPSSFVMVALTAASAALLAGRHDAVVAWGAAGLVWGWPVAGVAFVPAALAVLAAPTRARSFGVAVAAAVATLAPLVVVDRVMYGRWTVSLLNFVTYNVAGGGDSALYGVEPWHYYVRNGFLNLGLALPLASALPLALALAGPGGRPRAPGRLLAVAAALPLWGAAITALPHKEERFLYPVYPLATLAAGATLACAPSIVARATPRPLRRPAAAVARAVVPVAVLAAAALGVSRTLAVTRGYGAPLAVYRALPPAPPASLAGSPPGAARVCLGAEWHRFPSSFLLPSTGYAPAFVASGFDGLLPLPFNASAGGTAAAPPTLNDRNAHAPSHELPDASTCDFFVGVLPPAGDAPPAGRAWRVRAEAPFVDVGASRGGLLRAFYVPRLTEAAVARVRYAVMERVGRDGAPSGSARIAAGGGAA